MNNKAIKSLINEISTALCDSLFLGDNDDVHITPELKMLMQKHPNILEDIAHLYNIDEKKYNDICKYAFVGKQWKCSLAEVESEIMKILKMKNILANMNIFIDRDKNTKWNTSTILDLQSYVLISRKIMYSFDLFVEFLRANL